MDDSDTLVALKAFTPHLESVEVLKQLLGEWPMKYSKLLNDSFSEYDMESLPIDSLETLANTPDLDAKIIKSARLHSDTDTERRLVGDDLAGSWLGRSSSITAAYVGHVAIYIGNGDVINCTTGSDASYSAVHRLSLSSYINGGGTIWGYRKLSRNQPSTACIVKSAKKLMARRTRYDGAHNNQQGKWFDRCVRRNWIGYCTEHKRDYWEADCVGFIENIFNSCGCDITPRSYEVGVGWPLTPREQRDHMKIIHAG